MACMNATTPLLGGEENPDVEMERHLSCSVCLELYIDPVLLPCLHSLCRGCVEKMTNHGSVRSLTFKCPECNANVQLDDGGHWSLKRNFPLSSMVSIYKQSTLKRQKSASKLQSHEGAPKRNEFIPVNMSERPLPPIPSQKKSPPVPAVRHSKARKEQDQEPHRVPVLPTPNQTPKPYHNVYHTLESMQQTDENANQTIQTVPGQEVPGVSDADPQGSQAPAPSVPEIPRTCNTCVPGQERPADTYCETCGLSFCSYCLHGYHPDGMGHILTQLNNPTPQPQQDDSQQQCPVCDPASPSLPTVRCLECEMAFCDQCLQNWHPSTKTIPGHTLVEIKANSKPSPSTGTGTETTGTRTRTGAAAGTGTGVCTGVVGTGQSTGGQVTQPSVGSQGGNRTQPTGQSRHSGCSIEGLRSSSQFDMGGLVQLTGTFPCSECAHYTNNMAAINCLDCSRYYCEGCGGTHGESFPTHTLMDIRLHQTDQAPSTGQAPSAPRAPGKSSKVQLKLVELMDIRAEAMAELLRVLEGRRAELERDGV